MSAFNSSAVSFSYSDTSNPGLKLVGKRYLPPGQQETGLTPIFAHCTGAHKELWEPVIESLFKLKDPETGVPLIREAWSFDWQSHGEAAVVNDPVLKNAARGLSVQDWATALRAFVTSDNLSGHKLVGIGHSSGATAILLSTLSLPTAEIPYKAIILVEPSLITRTEFDKHLKERAGALAVMRKAIDKRRDTWNDRNEATGFFKGRIPWKIWDARILDLFVAHGLREVRVQESGCPSTKITLSCTKLQEQTAYDDNEPHFAAVERLKTLDIAVPVHCVFGDRADLVPKYAHDSILGVRDMTTIKHVPRAGHFVLQENPNGLASCIGQILSDVAVPHAKL
ncbi:hypothetical protein AcV5_003971 [Taiwanofungus camphoratus]|nr:hypothetical protein AcV5_003971 [Antrodia cinnamomea]